MDKQLRDKHQLDNLEPLDNHRLVHILVKVHIQQWEELVDQCETCSELEALPSSTEVQACRLFCPFQSCAVSTNSATQLIRKHFFMYILNGFQLSTTQQLLYTCMQTQTLQDKSNTSQFHPNLMKSLRVVHLVRKNIQNLRGF